MKGFNAVAKTTDVLAYGNCYIDVNVPGYPFSDTGIPPDCELIGGQYALVPGGSAVNFCRTLQNLDVQTTFIGMRGDDLLGEAVEKLIVGCGMAAHFDIVPGTMTNISYNMTNKNGKHIMLLAGTANQHLSATSLMPVLRSELDAAKMLYAGGLYKQTMLQPVFSDIVQASRACDTKLIVDHGRVPEGVSSSMKSSIKQLVMQADYYFPSRAEFQQTWEVSDIAQGLRLLKQLAPQLVVVVKNGDDGAYCIEDDTILHVAAVTVETVAEVTGAGDTFNAGVIASILAGNTLRDAVQEGCALAAKKISSGGDI